MKIEPQATIGAAKDAARAEMRAVRRALGDDSRESASRAATERLVAVPAIALARLVLVYSATPDELDPAWAVAILRARGVAIAYPRMADAGGLDLHTVGSSDELVAGRLGIREPQIDASRVTPGQIDAVVVPCVAFDEELRRLGYGGGYYDRLLPTLRADCVRIGIAFDEQRLEEVPAEKHDVRLDAVVTPTRTLRGAD